MLGIPLFAAAIAVPTMALSASGSPSLVHSKTFSLVPASSTLVPCLQAPGKTAKATVKVTRGSLNDTLTVTVSGFKPHLGFDIFTISDTAKPFGLAWYQSDLESNATGGGSATIKTKLLDEMFGALNGSVTQVTHIGFWFNKPSDAATCGFAGPPTPFNGEHDAGPLAFVSTGAVGHGPLCTKPTCP
jgi:hypothetical protein